jgi:hypothetical protein
LAGRISTSETDLERAAGAQQRTKAENHLRELRGELEEVEQKIAVLESGEDEAYRRFREQAHERRYTTPRVERLVDAELRIK